MTTLARQVVLIGPTCAGKTTIGALVGALLGAPFIDLDEVAEPYYTEAGFGMEAVQAMGKTLGHLGTFHWWQQGHPHAVRRVLEDYPNHVIALGAGHTTYSNVELFREVQDLLKDLDVVLVLPSSNPETSLSALRERNVTGRDFDWVMDGTDVLAEWVTSVQNAQLASFTVYTAGQTPDESASNLIGLLNCHGEE